MTVERAPLEPLDAVFFDFDGVILESVQVKLDGFRFLFADHSLEVRDAAAQFDAANHGLSRFEKFRWCCEELLQVDATDELMADLDRRFSTAILQRVLTAPFVPGAVEFLERWLGRFDCFVVSAAPQHEIDFVVTERSLASFFVSVHGSPVTKTDWLGHLLRTHELRPSRTAMIGDAVSDAIAAAAWDVPFVARLRAEADEPFEPNSCLACVPDLTNLAGVLGLEPSVG